MKNILFVLSFFALFGCSKTFDAGPDSRFHKILADSRQLAQAALIHEYKDEGSDADRIVSIEELYSEWVFIDKTGIKDEIRKGEILYIPQRMPIDRNAIITIAVVGDYIGVTRANMTTETFLKK